MTEALLDHEVPGDLMTLWLDVESKMPHVARADAPEASGLDWWVPRSSWGARAPKAGILGISPTFGTTIHYAGTGMPFDHAQCAAAVRGIQTYHMDHNGWLDIAYSSLGCQHGYVFEGRGAHERTAANGNDTWNAKSLAHCLMIGGDDVPTDVALRLAGGMAAFYQNNGAGGDVNGHRDCTTTDCPGDPTYGDLPQIRSYMHPPTPAPTPQPQPPQEGPMRDERIVVVPAPDANGRQIIADDKDKAALGHWSTFEGVTVCASAAGDLTPLTIQPCRYLDALLLSFGQPGGGVVQAGREARIVICHS